MAPSDKIGRTLQGYKQHVVSEQLQDRYPYLEDINAHLQHDDVSMAYGDRQFPRFVEQLKYPLQPEELAEALRTICDLCAHQENKATAVTSDVIPAATNLLASDAVIVQREAARVIGAMAKLLGGRSCMPIGNSKMPMKEAMGNVAPGPTLPRLAKLLLGCEDELVKRNVAEAMFYMTIFRDGCQQVVDQGTVKAIAQYLCGTLPDMPPTEPLGTCLIFLLQTLAAVTMYAKNGMRDVFGVGLIAHVISLLGRIPGKIPVLSEADSTECVRQALRFLWHCGNDQVGRKEMLKADGVRVITGYLNDPDAKVRESSICALNVISLETAGKQEVLKHSVEPLAKLLHSQQETTYLHETAIQLCRCASELPAFRFAFAQHILESVWLLEKLYGTTALAAVSPLLGAKEQEATRTKAAQVMSHFLNQTDPPQGDLIRVPPVCPLGNTKKPALFAIEECVGILNNLSSLLFVSQGPALDCLLILLTENKGREEFKELLAEGTITIPDDVRPKLEAAINV